MCGVFSGTYGRELHQILIVLLVDSIDLVGSIDLQKMLMTLMNFN